MTSVVIRVLRKTFCHPWQLCTPFRDVYIMHTLFDSLQIIRKDTRCHCWIWCAQKLFCSGLRCAQFPVLFLPLDGYHKTNRNPHNSHRFWAKFALVLLWVCQWSQDPEPLWRMFVLDDVAPEHVVRVDRAPGEGVAQVEQLGGAVLQGGEGGLQGKVRGPAPREQVRWYPRDKEKQSYELICLSNTRPPENQLVKC